MAFKKGDIVKLKGVIPQGPVVKFRMDEETGIVSYLIQWTDSEGVEHERWFEEADLIGA
jgi:uncharacterized protein YodC (DUF2158 family)